MQENLQQEPTDARCRVDVREPTKMKIEDGDTEERRVLDRSSYVTRLQYMHSLSAV